MNKNKLNIENLDLPNLIRQNNYYNFSIPIKNYENTIQKLFIENPNSELLENPFLFLWKLTEKDLDIFPHVNNFDLSSLDLKLTENFKNVVITGPYIRSYLVKKQDYPVRNEIYIYKYNTIKWEEMLDISLFSETKTEYIYEDANKRISLVKKKFISPSHILLQHNFLKRVGFIDDSFYVSSMFMLEYQNHLKYLESNFKDPYLNRPYDPLDIYEYINTNFEHPIKAIEMADLDYIKKINKNQLNKLYGIKKYNNKEIEIVKLTPIEFCIEKYSKEKNPVILNELKQIILFLNNENYKRPPLLYANLINLETIDPELYFILLSTTNRFAVEFDESTKLYSYDDINLYVIENLISRKMNNEFVKYIEYIDYEIDTKIIDLINKYNKRKNNDIIALLINQNKIDESLCYYATLMSENFELLEYFTFNYDLALDYLKDIIEKGLCRSLYFLLKNDDTILNINIDENGNNVLHLIKLLENKVNLKDTIDLIMVYNPELINKKNNFNETPIIYYAKNCPELLEYFIDYDIDISKMDENENTFIHYLSRHNNPKLLKMYLKKYNSLINLPNQHLETSAIIACKYKAEDSFYTIKNMGADLTATDIYGNSVYHYICKNSICIGHIIDNNENKFGIKPSDYCSISLKFYNFME